MNYEQKFTCLDCKKVFQAPDFMCTLTGDNHKVAEKIYHVEAGSLTVEWKSERVYPNPEGKGTNITIAGRTAKARRGIITSSDPEEQLFFDAYKGCIAPERWKDIHIPAAERELETKRETVRLEATKNALLDDINQLKQEQARVHKAAKG